MFERRVLAIGNQKGGVGKTTTTLNLGVELVNRGRTVILVDADPQHSLTTSLGTDAAGSSLAEVLGDHRFGMKEMSEVLRKARGNGDRLWLVPSDLSLEVTSLSMMNRIGREILLKQALSTLKADYVLIDCPPEVVRLAIDLDKNFIDMPFVTRLHSFFAQFLGIFIPKFETPLPYRFIAYDDASLCH